MNTVARNAILGLCIRIKHVCRNTCSIIGGGAAIRQLFLSASANASNYLASTSRPLARAALGLCGPGSPSVEGEPNGLFSLFSRL